MSSSKLLAVLCKARHSLDWALVQGCCGEDDSLGVSLARYGQVGSSLYVSEDIVCLEDCYKDEQASVEKVNSRPAGFMTHLVEAGEFVV